MSHLPSAVLIMACRSPSELLIADARWPSDLFTADVRSPSLVSTMACDTIGGGGRRRRVGGRGVNKGEGTDEHRGGVTYAAVALSRALLGH